MTAPAVLPPHASAADVLAAAADVMARLGKSEGDYTDERGRVCALGALCMVTLGRATPPDLDIITPADQEEAYIAAERALRRWLIGRPEAGWGVATPVWSDIHTEQEVVAGLRAAAEHARAQEQHRITGGTR